MSEQRQGVMRACTQCHAVIMWCTWELNTQLLDVKSFFFFFSYRITLSLSSFIIAVSTGWTHTPWHLIGSGLFLVFSLSYTHPADKALQTAIWLQASLYPRQCDSLALLLSRWVPQPSQGTLPLAAPCRAPQPPGSYTWWSEVELV